MTGWTARTALRMAAARALREMADGLEAPDEHRLTADQQDALGTTAGHGIGVTVPEGAVPYVDRAARAAVRRHADALGRFDPGDVAADLRAAADRLDRRR